MDHDACYEVLEALLDHTKIPTYTPDLNSDKIHYLAQEAYERDTFDGYLSYVLMANQVCEEYTRVLVRHTQFLLRLHTVTRGFSWSLPTNQTGRHLNDMMFGRLLDLLRYSVEFNCKQEWLDTCTALSQIRNRMAHQIGRSASIEQVREIAEEFKRKYDTVVDLFNEADEEMSWHYFEMIHDVMFDTLIDFELHILSSDAQRERWLQLQERLNVTRSSSAHKNLRGPSRYVFRQ
jgi:hypothetical protein